MTDRHDRPLPPDEVIRACVRALAHFRTPAQIAADLGLPLPRVRRVLEHAGLPSLHRTRPRSATVRRARALAADHSTPEIAALLGVPRTVVTTARRYAGDTARPAGPIRPPARFLYTYPPRGHAIEDHGHHH